MRYIADLHLHSKYSRACAKNLDLENNEKWCRWKGINIIGTADFTHPAWFKELQEKLTEKEPGLYQLKNTGSPVRFILTTEISCIYSQGGKTRRVHICIFAPSLKTVEKIIGNFNQRGYNLKADGRPILGLSAKNLAQLILEIDPDCLIVPAHAWTPWFSVFGSKSGFDSLAECFEELTPHIHAIETGLSSDPPMNWQLSALDKITLISNSDAHSPANLGREANVFELEEKNLSYYEICRVIKEKDRKSFLFTIEFFPEEGKYHFDGHLKCQYSAHPQESKKNKNLCPVCKKELTLGVMHRVNELADREKPLVQNQIPYKNLIPLAEIIAEISGVNKNAKKVFQIYSEMVEKYPEFVILLDLNEEELKKITTPEIVLGIMNTRAGQIKIEPGYDGKYGMIKIFGQSLRPNQNSLF